MLERMTLTAEDRAAARPALCPSCGGRLYPTIVGPRCPIHGAEGLR